MTSTMYMQANVDFRRTTDILTCPVCRQLFKNPRYLSCYHFYCEQCLEGIQVQSKITCPECRKETTVPIGGVKQLQSNFFIHRIVDELTNRLTREGDEEVQCDNCDENDLVVSFCSYCSSFLCQICHNSHKRARQTRNHRIVILSEINTNPDEAFIKSLQCKEHGSNELQYYCETCDELICIYCTVKEHNGHNHGMLKNMASKCRRKINETIGTIEDMFKGRAEHNSEIEMMINKIKDQETKVIKEVDEHFDTLVDRMLKQKYQLKQQVYNIASEKVKALTMQLEEIGTLQMQFAYTKGLNDSAKKSSNPDEMLLSRYKQITTDTKQLIELCNRLDTKPAELDTIQFFADELPLPQFCQVLSQVDHSESELSNPPKCIFQDVPVEFSITTKYANGHCYLRGGNKVSVQAQLLSESGNTENIVANVRDNKNGTYTAALTVKQAGKVNMLVFLDGQQIKGSPYSITVGKNYPAIKKPSNIVEINGHMAAKPWGIAFGNKNGVWAVADWSNNCICVYQNEDQLLWKFGSRGYDMGQLDGPCGIALDEKNYLYVADYHNHRVQKFDINGNPVLQFTGKESGNGRLSNPVDVTIHRERVYVADSTANCIVKFCTNGQFCQTIGKDHLINPNGVTVDCNERLLVTTIENNCVYIFTLDGNFLGKFGGSGSGIGQLSSPRSITSDSNGLILVTDTGNHRISIFNKDGNCVHCFGSKGTGTNQFLNPRGIEIAPNGNIYISDNVNNCIKIFKV